MNAKPLRIIKKVSEPVEAESNLVTLIETLLKIDTQAPLAKLNETTISDNNGGRIRL